MSFSPGHEKSRPFAREHVALCWTSVATMVSSAVLQRKERWRSSEVCLSLIGVRKQTSAECVQWFVEQTDHSFSCSLFCCTCSTGTRWERCSAVHSSCLACRMERHTFGTISRPWMKSRQLWGLQFFPWSHAFTPEPEGGGEQRPRGYVPEDRSSRRDLHADMRMTCTWCVFCDSEAGADAGFQWLGHRGLQLHCPDLPRILFQASGSTSARKAATPEIDGLWRRQSSARHVHDKNPEIRGSAATTPAAFGMCKA